jgi:hypothetical protein
VLLGPGTEFAVTDAAPGTRFLLMTGQPYGEAPVFNGPTWTRAAAPPTGGEEVRLGNVGAVGAASRMAGCRPSVSSATSLSIVDRRTPSSRAIQATLLPERLRRSRA